MKRLLFLILLLPVCCGGAMRIAGDRVVERQWLEDNCSDPSDCQSLLLEAITASGYYEATVRLSIESGDTIFTVDRGRAYSVENLMLIGVPDSVAAAVLSSFPQEELLSVDIIDKIIVTVARYYAENGYPFAELHVQQMVIENERLYLDCLLISGPSVNVGSIRFSGLRTTSPQTLTARLSLREGERYRERELEQAAATLSRLRFSRLVEEPTVLFNNRSEAADIHFQMDDKRNLSVGGGLFLLPGATLAGNLDLAVLNLLGGGRELKLFWSKKDEHSQRLKFDLLFPYFSRLPIDLRLVLEQEDRDSTFISSAARVGADYSVSGAWSLGVDLGWAKVTPEENRDSPSARVLSVAIASGYDHRDDPFRTSSGELLRYRFGSSYRREFGRGDSVVSGYSTELTADLRFWRPLGQSLVGYCGLHAFQTRSDFEPVPQDQLIAIGGSETMRGYREESFLARIGLLTTVELRWYALDRLLLRIFADNGYIRTLDADFGLTGFGAGLSVATTAGTARFDLSLGEEKTMSKLLVHFGFESEL